MATWSARKLLAAIDCGHALRNLDCAARAEVVDDVVRTVIVGALDALLAKQNMKVRCDRGHAPYKWIEAILKAAEGRSHGRVEQHLVGAKLERRFPDAKVPTLSAHAADLQTGRTGDFELGSASIHVTGAPSAGLLEKCAESISSGWHPIIVTPRDKVERIRGLAEAEGIENQISFLAIEDFLATNILELSLQAQTAFFDELKNIVALYNRRVDIAEADKSIRLDVE